MRKLLIKLVAIETAFLGWLSYWLFLVYANNPSIADQLVSSLQRFPQLSFSTIDIAVLVIIAALAVTLAFKFQRGMRPGIRLERALQMLENLMKRNLILESQVAELKIEKSHASPMITAAPAVPSSSEEPRQGSWEKAFRTPLEAGPPITTKKSAVSNEDIPFGRQSGVPPPRIETKPQPSPADLAKPSIVISEKGTERASISPNIIADRPPEKPAFVGTASSSSVWEDSPKYLGESKGILTPSPPPRKAPAVSESGGLRQPYIPAPVPKTTPPSVIVGPMTMTSTPAAKTAPSPTPRILARPSGRQTGPAKTPSTLPSSLPTSDMPKPEVAPPPIFTPTASPSSPKPSGAEDNLAGPNAPESKPLDETVDPEEKTRVRESQSQPTKKKPPSDKTETSN